jgi:hypothetical protein
VLAGTILAGGGESQKKLSYKTHDTGYAMDHFFLLVERIWLQ